jgi:hypothetical protein
MPGDAPQLLLSSDEGLATSRQVYKNQQYQKVAHTGSILKHAVPLLAMVMLPATGAALQLQHNNCSRISAGH